MGIYSIFILQWGVTPLIDNRHENKYYLKVTVYTGLRRGAGTKSKVCFILSGDYGDSGIRMLTDGQKVRDVIQCSNKLKKQIFNLLKIEGRGIFWEMIETKKNIF